mgnify:CR=1 FL=1
MIDLSSLAVPLALLSVAAPPPPDPIDPPPPFSAAAPSRVLLERAVVRWERWYWKAPGAGAVVSDVAATCGPTRPGAKLRRCFITYRATAPEEQSVQIIDWFRRCRVVRGSENLLIESPPASGVVPLAVVALGGGRALECVFSGYAVAE